MKKFLSIICIVLVTILFAGCTKPAKYDAAESLEHHIANNIENINNIQKVSDETIKALSVIIRTNSLNENKNFAENSKKTYDENHNKIYLISSQTKGEILTNNNSISKLEISEDFSPYWETEIKKSSLLSFLNKNNISLSSISNISQEVDEKGNINAVIIVGKKIEYNAIKDEFSLKSNKITKIDNNLTSLVIYGENPKSTNCFYVNEAEKLVKEGYDYKQLLNHFFNGFDLKTTPQNQSLITSNNI